MPVNEHLHARAVGVECRMIGGHRIGAVAPGEEETGHQPQQFRHIARAGAADGVGVDDRDRTRCLVERLRQPGDGQHDRQVFEIRILRNFLCACRIYQKTKSRR